MPANDIVEVSLICQSSTQNSFNIRHYRRALTIGGDVTLTATAARFSDVFHAAYKQVLSENASFLGCNISKIFPLPRSLPVGNQSQSGPGTVLGDLLPGQVAGLIGHRTLFAGRRFRGRSYIPFPGEADNTTFGFPTTQYLLRLTTLAAIFPLPVDVTEGASTNAWIPVIWHRDDSTFNDIVDSATRSRWATMRRRSDIGGGDAPPVIND